jgi:hypothetical protein
MKAKKIISENNEQPNPLPTPSDQERRDELAPWKKEIIALAEARLSVDGKEDIICEMHRRAIGLCRIVEDLALCEHDSELSLSALAKVMQIAQEYIFVARYLTAKEPGCLDWF